MEGCSKGIPIFGMGGGVEWYSERGAGLQVEGCSLIQEEITMSDS